MQELHRLKDLSDYRLHGRDGDVGQLVQVYFDDRDWQIRYLVIQTGSWLLGRDVLLLPVMISGIDHDERRIDVALNCDQIRNAPGAESQLPVSRHYEMLFHQYYDWPPYWGDDPLLGLGVADPPNPVDLPEAGPSNPHLRSSSEIVGYGIAAADGRIGEVKDIVVEVSDWRLRYLGIATGNWLTGREVLIACAWLETVDWSDRKITTLLTREAIASAPAYHPHELISRDHELALYQHYGRHFTAAD